MTPRDDQGDVLIHGPSVELPERPNSEAVYSGRSEDLWAAVASLQAVVDAERLPVAWLEAS